MYTLSSAGLIFGVLVLIGSMLFELKPYHRKVWGAMVLVFSVFSIIMGGGFVVGLVLGIASGILVFSHKSKMPLPKTN
jgi:MFS superfamily sulfate permease-like transporter